MNLLDVASRKFNRSPLVIFCFAYQYAEIRININIARDLYQRYQKTNEVPETVTNYCLDVLAKRTGIPKLFNGGKCQCGGENTLT